MAPTSPQKKSEKREVDQASGEAAAFRALKAKVESLVDFILNKKIIHTELKNIVRSTNRAGRVRQSPKPKKTASSNKDGSSVSSPLIHKGKAILENSKHEGTTPPETPRHNKAKGGERRRKVPPSTTPIRSQAKDLDWTTVIKGEYAKKLEAQE